MSLIIPWTDPGGTPCCCVPDCGTKPQSLAYFTTPITQEEVAWLTSAPNVIATHSYNDVFVDIPPTPFDTGGSVSLNVSLTTTNLSFQRNGCSTSASSRSLVGEGQSGLVSSCSTTGRCSDCIVFESGINRNTSLGVALEVWNQNSAGADFFPGLAILVRSQLTFSASCISERNGAVKNCAPFFVQGGDTLQNRQNCLLDISINPADIVSVPVTINLPGKSIFGTLHGGVEATSFNISPIIVDISPSAP